MTYQYIKYESGRIARVILNRPKCMNALNAMIMEEVDQAFTRAVEDDDVRVIILSAAGDHFSTGHDLGTPEWKAEYEKECSLGYKVSPKSMQIANFIDWRNLLKPTIAMVQGHCFFAGYASALCMDVIFASEEALFLPFFLIHPPMPWDLPPRKSKEILFEHRPITALEAKKHGLVNQVYSRDILEQKTLEHANRMADNYAIAVRSKQVMNYMQDIMGFNTHMMAIHHLGPASTNERMMKLLYGDEDKARELVKKKKFAQADKAIRNLEKSMDGLIDK